MLPPFTFLVYLHQWQSRVNWMQVLCTVVLTAFVIGYACNSRQTAALAHQQKQAGAAASKLGNKAAGKKIKKSLATIQTADYEVNLHWAIPFTPRSHGEGLVQADSGSHFVLLDLSVKNTSAERAVDVGELLLSAKIRDNNGGEYASDPLVIAAFNLEYPYPNHQAQYQSLKGILQPGESGRTIVLGFEAPAGVKQFSLLFANPDGRNENGFYEGDFCLK